MAKRFKLKLSLSSFQFCSRSNQKTSSLPKSPLPASTLFSPINPKSLEISFPSFPDPPPTPNCPSKIMPVSFSIECNQSTRDTQKMYNSPVSYHDSDDSTAWPMTPPKGHKKIKNRRKNSRRTSISSADSGWFSSEEDHVNDEESESLIMSSSENFDSSCDFGIIPISTSSTRKKKNSTSVKVRRLRRYVSNSWKSGGGEEIPVRKSSSSSVFRRSCAVEGKVKESFAVVKNSENPYEDFKGSMMEMILEKQMFEPKDLEQLLQCFLSLNSRHHHAAIVQAFSEIWEALFL